MRAPPLLPLRLKLLLRPRPMAKALVEVTLLAWAVVLLEAVGARVAPGGAADVFGFVVAAVLAACLAAAAKAGHLPGTSRVFQGLKRGGISVLRRLDPPSGVAFRLPPQIRQDRARRAPAAVLLVLVVLALLFGHRLLPALGWVRDHVSFTVHLLGLVVLWGLYGTITVAALLAARVSLRGRGEQAARLLPMTGLIVAVVALAALPGWAAAVIFAAVTLASVLAVVRKPIGSYHLYRREPDGVCLVVAVHDYLRGAFMLVMLVLLLATVLAQTSRFTEASFPTGPFTLTQALGLSATAGALLLVLRLAAYLHRMLGAPDTWPEVPLVPTLWWPASDPHLGWVREARDRGWVVDGEIRVPPGGYDLLAEREGDPQRFRLPPRDLDLDEACFRLERRFHVVKRRVFYRRFRSLHKRLLAQDTPGCGYLFCPHAWPIPGVVRDTGGAVVEDASGRSQLGGLLVGPPFASVFPVRLRRYLHGVFQALDLDVLYWEDGVKWSDLRRVLGVMFENYDQGRFPAQDRHFLGLPRVRVLIQEPEDGEEAFLEAPACERDATPPPLRARALVIRKDGGGDEVDAPTRAPSTRRPEPVGAV